MVENRYFKKREDHKYTLVKVIHEEKTFIHYVLSE